jgi:uncharacterized protein YndB with AHSA1/START domain
VKIVQWTLTIVGVLALVLIAAGHFWVPATFDVRRSTLIKAPPDKVYDLIADPRRWKGWSAWQQKDPAMEVTYSGPLFGQGAKWSWKSASQGNGRMEFVRVVPDSRVEYTLVLNNLNLTSRGIFAIEPSKEGTRVTWSNAGDVGTNPLKHYLAAAMDRLAGPDFEQGLANLKALAEKP